MTGDEPVAPPPGLQGKPRPTYAPVESKTRPTYASDRGGDPPIRSVKDFQNDDVTAKELELLHQEVIQIGGDLYMEREIGRGLSVAYDKLLKE